MEEATILGALETQIPQIILEELSGLKGMGVITMEEDIPPIQGVIMTIALEVEVGMEVSTKAFGRLGLSKSCW